MKSRIWKSASWVLLLGVVACSGGQKQSEVPVALETAADEIQRVSSRWSHTEPAQGILSPPSPISVFHTTTRSVITMNGDQVQEELTIWEDLDLRDGTHVRCASKFKHQLGARFGRKLGEAAVEITRPPLGGKRTCEGTHPEPEFRQGARVARFVLRSDRLIAVEPATDGRTYLPESE